MEFSDFNLYQSLSRNLCKEDFCYQIEKFYNHDRTESWLNYFSIKKTRDLTNTKTIQHYRAIYIFIPILHKRLGLSKFILHTLRSNTAGYKHVIFCEYATLKD